MENKRAFLYYRHPDYKFNCAQAIAFTQTEDMELVQEFKNCGSGKAEGGVCGALFAALLIATKKGLDAKTIENKFIADIGSVSCKEICTKKLATCEKCIDVAEILLRELEESSLQKSQKNGQ